jgi:hypothetical protein
MSSDFRIVSSQKVAPSARVPVRSPAIAALEAARKAGVEVTANCQCPGIFIDGHQYCAEGFVSANGAPTHVSVTILAALITHAVEIEALLKAAGWWSCGCKGGAGVAS